MYTPRSMGTAYKANCRACGNAFRAYEGGGRRSELLRCGVCGSTKWLSYEEIGEPLLKLERVLRANEDVEDPDYTACDRACEEYHREVEAAFGSCKCGERMTFGAPIRCPACRSTDIDLGKPWRLYD